MKFFNALQVVVMFAALPFLLEWLHAQSFYAAGVAFYTAIVIYFVLFVVLVTSLADTFKKWD